jgi:uncharacterized DUF497 family protein
MVIKDGFEWDPLKDEINREKHGVSFAEACEVFASPTVSAPDERFPYGEERWITVGETGRGYVLVIAHTQRARRLRIISARPANKKERLAFYAKVKPTL